MLLAWLEFHRSTLATKCTGLTDDQLRQRSVPPSRLTLLGLVRHMAKVERYWFRQLFAGEDLPKLYGAKERPDTDFDDVEDADVAQAFTDWQRECEVARHITGQAHSLDAVGARQRYGEEVSMRWILLHMIEEYARHNGHADLLRESIDGTTGM